MLMEICFENESERRFKYFDGKIYGYRVIAIELKYRPAYFRRKNANQFDF